MKPNFRIVPGNLTDPQLVDLVTHHVRTARSATARCESSHALDIIELQQPTVSLWTAWENETLLGCGALKHLSSDHGEIKSMHTTEAARRKGIGSALVNHLLAIAKSKGMKKVSLETGSAPYFAPARALYEKMGFRECAPFADYKIDPNSVFMTIDLVTFTTA